MKRTILLTVLIMSFSLVLFSFAKASRNNAVLATHKTDSTTQNEEINKQSLSDSLFTGLNLEEVGLSKETLDVAVKGYEKLLKSGSVENSQYLTIVDLSQSSRKKRFYIIDMNSRRLVWNTYVAHGKNSGLDEAEYFSNNLNSEESSLGFYLTKTTYSGKHGLSLRISGLEEGFNDNAEKRGIVVHGASYVNDQRAQTDYMGRSQGCPALPQNEYAQVIRLIKNGSVLFIYHPDTDYLQSSRFINS